MDQVRNERGEREYVKTSVKGGIETTERVIIYDDGDASYFVKVENKALREEKRLAGENPDDFTLEGEHEVDISLDQAQELIKE